LADGAGVAASSLVVDDADFFTQWGLIQIGSEDYSGAGIQINADPNHSTETLTLESTFTWSDNDIVRPHIPAATFIGNAKYGTNCTVSLDGGSTTVKVIRGSVVINTGLELMNQSSGHTGPDDITQQKLPEGRVDFNLELFVRRDETYLMSHAHRKVSKDLQIKLGTTATDRFTINMDTCEIDPAARDIGDSGPATWPLNGKALGSGSGENEIQLVQD